MGTVTDGMDITDYIENDTRDYLLVHYKVTDDFSDEKYREMFQSVERHITANLNVTLFPRENLLFRHIITRK